MEKEKTPPSEDELKRLIALDRAAVEEHLSKNKTQGKKIGAAVTLAIILAAMITIFVIIAINSHR